MKQITGCLVEKIFKIHGWESYNVLFQLIKNVINYKCLTELKCQKYRS